MFLVEMRAGGKETTVLQHGAGPKWGPIQISMTNQQGHHRDLLHWQPPARWRHSWRVTQKQRDESPYSPVRVGCDQTNQVGLRATGGVWSFLAGRGLSRKDTSWAGNAFVAGGEHLVAVVRRLAARIGDIRTNVERML